MSYNVSTCSRQKNSRRAFTLVELMVVIVIIGLLSGMVTLSVRSYLIAGKQSVAKMEISKISQALDTYYTQFDRYPSNEQGIGALVEKSKKFPEGILNKIPVDPWGNPYQYNYPGQNGAFDLISFGADFRPGGEGADSDILSSNLGNDN